MKWNKIDKLYGEKFHRILLNTITLIIQIAKIVEVK